MNNIILETRSLSKSFDGISAVESVSIKIPEGTITSIIGPNGAGKTSLFNIISGFVEEDSGLVLFREKTLNGSSAWQRSKMGLGRLWQDVRSFKNMTALESLLVAYRRQPGEKISNLLFRPARVRHFEQENVKRALEILGFLGLSDKKNSASEDLSYGQQKLLAMGRLLMNDSEMLLLDEPTAGINPVIVDDILSNVVDLVKQFGKTVLMIEHNVRKAMDISNLVYVMDSGKVALSGSPSEVSADPRLKEVYLGV